MADKSLGENFDRCEAYQPAPDWSDSLKVDPLSAADQQKLNNKQVLVREIKTDGKSSEKSVEGRILLNESPEQVWRVLANPYEFADRIFPRMHNPVVLDDKKEHSTIKCTIGFDLNIPLTDKSIKVLPDLNMTVDTDYVTNQSIAFHQVSGWMKEMSGGWKLIPQDNGKKTELVYRMHVDTGMPIPGVVVREGLKHDLPRTLKAIRDRVDEIVDNKDQPVSKTIRAADI